jgi:hypothetical protein
VHTLKICVGAKEREKKVYVRTEKEHKIVPLIELLP